MNSIHKLGHLQDFLRRAAQLNQVHSPEDPVHDHLRMASEEFRAATDAANQPQDEVLQGAVAARKGLSSLHREFPTGAPVHEQAAYLLRGIAGLQPFAAASDLTGWDLVAETLEHHGFDLLAESEDGRGLVTELWTRLQQTHPQGFTRRDLLERDDVLEWLSGWYRARIVATGEHPDMPERRA